MRATRRFCEPLEPCGERVLRGPMGPLAKRTASEVAEMMGLTRAQVVEAEERAFKLLRWALIDEARARGWRGEQSEKRKAKSENEEGNGTHGTDGTDGAEGGFFPNAECRMPNAVLPQIPNPVFKRWHVTQEQERMSVRDGVGEFCAAVGIKVPTLMEPLDPRYLPALWWHLKYRHGATIAGLARIWGTDAKRVMTTLEELDGRLKVALGDQGAEEAKALRAIGMGAWLKPETPVSAGC